MAANDVTRFEAESISARDSGGYSWVVPHHHAAIQRARMFQRRRGAKRTRATRIMGLFLKVTHEKGLRDIPLRVRGHAGGNARAPLRGWYLRTNRTVGIGTQGRYYVLLMLLSLTQRLRRVGPENRPIPMTIGEGGRDDDTVPLHLVLGRLLPDWEESSPESLV